MSSTRDSEQEQTPGLRANGTPDPAYAVALGLVPASAGLRSLAFTIDLLIALVLAIPAVVGVSLMQGHLNEIARLQLADVIVPLVVYGIGEFLLIVYYVVQLILHGRRGITIGKAIFGIRSVRATTFAAPGFWRMVLRALVFAAACIFVPIIGGVVLVLSSLWDYEKRGRGWLDRIGGNWLVNVRAGLNPFDAKALRLARKRVAAPQKGESVQLPSLATGARAPRFVPDTRSSSGVVGSIIGRADAVPPGAEPWTPPPVGAPRQEEQAPVSQPTVSEPTVSQPTVTEPTVSQPTVTAATPAPRTTPPRTPHLARLIFDDGSVIPVSGAGLLGRDPQARHGEERHELIPIHDERRQVSKTHAEFGIDERGFWITDRSSVNGTRVVAANGERVSVPVGEHYPVSWGSVVEIGGRAFRVEESE